VENLAKSGAFECVEKNRSLVFNNVETLVAYAADQTASRNSSQMGLFGADTSANKLKLKKYPEWPALEKLDYEKEALGFYLSAHPLDSFETVLERMRVVDYADLPVMVKAAGGPVRAQVAALVSGVRERISQKGNRFAFVTASDKSGAFDCICFSDTLEASRDKLNSAQPLLFSVVADKREGEEQISVRLLSVDLLADVMGKTSSTLILNVESQSALSKIKDILASDGAGKSKVVIIVTVNDQEVELALPNKYALKPNTMSALSQIAGITSLKQV